MTIQYQLKDSSTLTAKESLNEGLNDLEQIIEILSEKYKKEKEKKEREKEKEKKRERKEKGN